MKLSWFLALLALAVAAPAAAPPPDVAAVPPVRGEITRFITLPATVRANQQATLYAKVSGYLKTIAVDKGDTVTAGQPLAELEAPELLADLAKAQADIKVAEIEFQRLTAAVKKAPDLITAQSLTNAEGRLLTATAGRDRAQTLLGFTQVVAPFAGVVTARFADPGAFIPAATASSTAQSAAVITLADFNTVRLQIPVPEAEASLVAKGQPVKFTVEGLPGKIFEASVTRFSYSLEDVSKTMLTEAELPNPGLALRPGMYAMARLGVEKHANALVVPAEAVVMEKGNAFVFTATGGRAKKTPVKLGFADGVQVELTSGATEQDTLLLVGKLTLTDGQAVAVKEGK